MSKSLFSQRASLRFSSIITFLFSCLVLDAAHAQYLCHVADPNDTTLNVRDKPNGKVINSLRNGRLVIISQFKKHQRGGRWVFVGGEYDGKWREWGWVFRAHLECHNPYKLKFEIISVKQLRNAGISFDQRLSIKCPDVGPWDISFSHELFRYYSTRGFSKRALCLALNSRDVHFDPETGKQLKLYRFIASGEYDDYRYAMHIPDCYRRIKIIRNGGYFVKWSPTGCKIKFHPTTGARIEDPSLVSLYTGGAAGDSPDESSTSENPTISDASLRRLLEGK